MKVGVAQINTTVGDFQGNRERILAAYREAVDGGAELVVTPEMAMTGYPPQDLIFRSGFVEENLEALRELAASIGAVPLVAGYVDKVTDSSGKPFEFVYAPEQKVNLGFFFGPFAGFTGSVEVTWRDRVSAPSFWNLIVNGDPTEARLDAYTLVTLAGSYDVAPGVQLFGRVENILDEDYQEIFGVEAAGVAAYGGIRVRLGDGADSP